MRKLAFTVGVLATACDGNGGGAAPDAALTPMLVIEPANLDLGVIEVGVPSSPQLVTIRNVGPGTTGIVLTTSAATLVVAANDCVTLPPQASCTAQLVATAPTQGALTGELRALAVAGGTAVVAPVALAGGYRVTVERSGGVDARVTSTPAGLDCGAACDALFVTPTVELEAEATFPTAFVGWTPQGEQPACSGSSGCTLSLSGPITVGAVFEVRTSLSVVIAGTGAGVVDSTFGPCGLGTCVYPATDGAQVLLTELEVAGSRFSGWSGGCSGSDNVCTAVIAGATSVTATFAAEAGVSWVRTSRVHTSPADLALTPDGVVFAGTQTFSSTDSAIYLGHYLADGTPTLSRVDDATGQLDRAIRVVALPSGGAAVLACVGGTSAAACPLALRRYDAAGALVWSVAPGGNMIDGSWDKGHGLAVDVAGNLYVTGADPGPYVVSYDATGGERWRRQPVTSPALTSIGGVAVRGDLVAVVGALAASPSDGWIGTYDRAGVAGWQRTVAPPPDRTAFALDDVEIDGDGDVVFGGDAVSSFLPDYIVGTVDASGASEQWRVQHAIRGTGQLAVHADDSVGVWLGRITTAADDSGLRRYTEAGVMVTGSIQNVFGIANPTGLAVDGAGAVYLSGVGFDFQWPSIQRR